MIVFGLDGNLLRVSDGGGTESVDLTPLTGAGTDNQKFNWRYINRGFFTNRY